MRRYRSIHLCWLLPIIILSAFVIMMLLAMLFEYRQHSVKLVQQSNELINARMANLQHRIEGLLRLNQQELIAEEIADYSSGINVNSLSLSNEEGKVLFSSHRIWQGIAILDDRSEFNSVRFAKAQQDRRLIIDSHIADDRIIAYQPVSMSTRPGEIRPNRVGVLLLDYSLISAKTNIRSELWDQWIINMSISAIAMTLMMLSLQYWLSRPLNYLCDEVKRISQGDFSMEVNIFGKGEMAQLGSSVNKMQIDLASAQSESQRSIEMLITREAELESKNAELEHYSYMVSHDLKSPLVTIKTFQGYLQQDMAQGDQARIEKDIDFMTKAADKMSHLLDELLEMSRTGYVIAAPEHINWRTVVEEALNINAGAIAQSGVAVTVDDTDITLFGDRPRLVQIYQNLIDNAVKFLGDQSTPQIRIGAVHLEQGTEFYVCDNGVGVDARYHDKIFGMFEKLDVEVSGSGLGLALVKRIIQQYHGKIRIESKGIGHGTCFRFTLPTAVKINKGDS